MRPAYYACIFLELTGLTHICWVLSHLMSCVFGMKEEKCPGDLETALVVLKQVESSLDGDDNSSNNTTTNCCDIKLSQEAHTEKQKEAKNEANNYNNTQFTGLVNKLNDSVDADTMKVLRHYLDSHPEKFHQFPSVVGNKVYPSPHAIAEVMKKQGHEPPSFLTDISDPEHIPPHIVACELLSQNKQLQDELDRLQQKLVVD